MQDQTERAVDKLARSAGVSRLSLSDFRNYARLEIDLDPAFNVLVGANAQGKTNLLESMYLLSTTRLMRGMRDGEAVRDGAERAVVKADLLHLNSQISIVLERGIRKRAQLNGAGLPRASDLIGRLPSISISSADLPIVSGEPSERRLFLDLELSQLYPSYLRHLTIYKRALDQRNALLKASQEEPRPAEQFEPWERELAEHGSALRTQRKMFLEGIQEAARGYHAHMGDGEQLALEYEQRDPPSSEQELAEALVASRHTDVHRGSTSVGPHRDDVKISVGTRDARLYGSQGQQRTSVISLKLATMDHAREHLGMPPLLLLDDILSDLDERRRAMLVEIVLERAGQAVLTCTEASAAGRDILERAKVFEVMAGAVKEL